MPRPYPSVGTFINQDNSCISSVWAPEKESIELVLKNESGASYLPMAKDEFEFWSVETKQAKPGTRYRYRINGKDEYPDPASLSQPEGVHGDSEIIDRKFNWTDDQWKGIERQEMIMYEIHVGTFSPRGDFQGVIERLDYLKELGINTIEIMPVAQFPGKRNWGYDGAFPFAVQNSYGGMKGLKNLVNAAHKVGIAVVLDVVYNHTGPEGSCFHAFGPYFIDKYKSPWGPVVNLDDEWSFGVRSFFIQNALMWLDEYHIDGLRMDAVHAMFDNSAKHFMQELNEEVRLLEERTGRKKILIAELDLNNPRYINPPEKGGFGLDAQWVDEFHHALHSVLTGETDGYYSDFGSITHLHKAYSDTYVYTGEYSRHRKRDFGVPVDNALDQFIVFSQNHDHTGNRMMGERLSSLISFDALKVAAAAVILSPYIPLLFMGEEYGEKNPFLYFISHEDEELVNAVRNGRKKEFSYFNWKADPPDPFSVKTFEDSFPCWNCEQEEAAILLSLYRELISIRKLKPALRSTSRESLVVLPLQNNILAYERIQGNSSILIVINFGKEIAEFSFDGSVGMKIFDSSEGKWRGNGETVVEAKNNGLRAKLNPLTVIIFEK